MRNLRCLAINWTYVTSMPQKRRLEIRVMKFKVYFMCHIQFTSIRVIVSLIIMIRLTPSFSLLHSKVYIDFSTSCIRLVEASPKIINSADYYKTNYPKYLVT